MDESHLSCISPAVCVCVCVCVCCRLCDDYLQLYCQAAANIRENTGDTVPEATLRLLVNKMLEEVRERGRGGGGACVRPLPCRLSTATRKESGNSPPARSVSPTMLAHSGYLTSPSAEQIALLEASLCAGNTESV